VNLDRIQHWIDQGRLTSSPDKPITARELLLSGCVHDVHDGIKLLGDVRLLKVVYVMSNLILLMQKGSKFLKSAIHIMPSRASASAIKAVEQKGGLVICRYYNPLSLRDCVKGRVDRLAAAPTRREDISAYLS
jgi:large subunit ribosomal protein L15